MSTKDNDMDTSQQSVGASAQKVETALDEKRTWEKIWDRIPLPLKDWTASGVIGFLVVSHWRSLWLLFDIWTCDQPPDATLAAGTNYCFALPAQQDGELRDRRFDSAVLSYFLGVGFIILGVLLMWGGLWFPDNNEVTPARGFVRFIVLYILGLAANCMWRGIWYLTDYWILPNDPIASYWLTSFVGAAGAFLICAGGSLLAPPSIFLLDGPSVEPPPIAVTQLSTYYDLTLPADANEPPKLPWYLYIIDALTSFYVIPIFVVWFWRGTWQLMDDWFWGFTESDSDVGMSVLYSLIFSLACAIVASEPVMCYAESLAIHDKIGKFTIGRTRTFIVAWATVAFWRAVWTAWDLWFGKSSRASAYGGEIGSIVCLTFIGCLACITAPPSTLGIDVVPHPDSADEPLFAMNPLPWDLLYIFAIGRNPPPVEVETGGKEDIVEEIELSRLDDGGQPFPPDDEEEADEARVRFRKAVHVVGSLNAGVTELRLGQRSYCEMQRPHLLERQKSVKCIKQRPGLENNRHRSQYFRNR